MIKIKKRIKRVFSLVMALSMVIGVLPAGYAEDAIVAEEKQVYNFIKAYNNNETLTYAQTITYDMTTHNEETKNGRVVLDFKLNNLESKKYGDATIENQGWEVNFEESASNLKNDIDKPNAALSYNANLGWLAYPSACSKIVVDFDVKVAGEYTVAMDIAGQVGLVDTINFYVVTPDANGDFTNATQTKVGTIGHSSFSGGSGTWVDMDSSITFANVNLKAGTNRFVIEDGTPEAYYSVIGLRSVTFTDASLNLKDELNTDIESEPWAYYGQSGSGYFRYVNAWPYSGLQNYWVGNINYIKLKVNKSGTYYPEAVLGGRIDYAGGITEIALHSLNDGQLNEIAKTSNVNSSNIHAPIRARLGTGPIALEAGEYVLSWEVTGTVPGFSADKQSVYLQKFELLTAEQGVIPKSAQTSEKLKYDFTVMYDAKNKNQKYADNISWQDTIDKGSAPWMMYSWYKTSVPYTSGSFYYTAENKGPQLNDHSGAIRVYVPTSGTYVPSVNMSTSSTSKNTVWAYLMKLKADGSVDSEVSYMPISMTAADGNKDYVLADAAIKLDAGEYILYARNMEGVGSFFNSLELQAVKDDLSFDVSEYAVKIDDTEEGSIEVIDESGTVKDMTGSTVKATVSDSSVADAVIGIENGKLTYKFIGKKRGSAKVLVYALTPDYHVLTQEIELYVNAGGIIVGHDHNFDFRKVHGDKITPITDVTEFEKTTKGNAVEINPDSAYETDPWKYISHKASFFEYGDNQNGIMLGETTGKASFGITVSKDGIYQFVSYNTMQPNGANVKVFLAPENAEDPTAEEYNMGILDTYAPFRTSSVANSLKIRSLKKGNYILTYELCGKNSAVTVEKTRFDFVKATLKATDSYSNISIAFESPGSLNVGESIEIPIIVTENDGASSWSPQIDVEAISSSDAVSCEVVSNAEKTEHTLMVTAKKPGSAIFTVRATKDKYISVTKDGSVLVIAPGSIAGRTYRYMFVKAMHVNDWVHYMDSYAKTFPGSVDEVRPGSGTDNWKFHSETARAFWYFDDTSGVALGDSLGSTGAIAIRLPESGIFRPVMQYTASNQCGIVRMYIAPLDADDPFDEKWAVGTIDTYDATSKIQNAIFRARNMSAGEYVIGWKLVGNNKDNLEAPRLWVGGVSLEPVSEYPEIKINTAERVTVKQGGAIKIPVSAILSDSSLSDSRVAAEEDLSSAEFKVISNGEYAAIDFTFDENGESTLTVSGLNQGSAEVGIGVDIDGVRRASFNINVTVEGRVTFDDLKISLPNNVRNILNIRDIEQAISTIEAKLYDEDGNEISLDGVAALGGAEYTFTSSNESVATIDESGRITPKAVGDTEIKCTVKLDNIVKTAVVKITIQASKREATYFTAERVKNARANVEKYSWARTQKNNAIAAADVFIENNMDEFLWNCVTTQELPRSYFVGYRGDPDAKIAMCRYCGVSLSAKYGDTYTAWIIDPVNSPWKLQCPDCRRKFPSNDFGKFWQAGIDENGNWRYELAKERGSQYLTNDLYPEKGAGWGVDDGYGYVTGRTYSNGIPEVHTYISAYNHWGIWYSRSAILHRALDDLRNAYILTGDKKYGRVGAILVDRIADVYPDMDANVYPAFFTEDSSYSPPGKILDYVWENTPAYKLAQSYDAFYDMYDDPYVIEFLSQKAKKYSMANTKETANQIRQNCEDGILRDIYKHIKNGNINGNFGAPHATIVMAAVVLDTFPETQEMIDWAFKNGEGSGVFLARNVTGGDIDRKLINSIDRDGHTNEIAPQYSNMWSSYLNNVVDILAGYEGYPAKDLYKNPKYVKSLYAQMATTLSNGGTVQIGDSGNAAGNDKYINPSALVMAYENTKLPIFAQMLYFNNGNSSKGLTYGIYSADPEGLDDEVQEVIDTYGEYDFTKSVMQPHYGFAMLRSGDDYSYASGQATYNTKRNFWMHFGRNTQHAHPDALNLGVEAYGLNMAPEFAYPIATTGDEYINWGLSTASHNTVVVDDKTQLRSDKSGIPYHFDDGDKVKVMDADARCQYENVGLDEYRRTVVMVEVDDEVSYGVDFFRVVGGKSHVYSFHALSDHLAGKPEGITLVPQQENGEYVGSYAGKNIPFKTSNYNSGYTYLKDVDRAENPGTGKFSVDFAITDFRNDVDIDESVDLHLRMNMLNEDQVEEVAIATGSPGLRNKNPQNLKFMMVRNNSSKSLFTAVIEPYAGERYIHDTSYIPSANITKTGGVALGEDDVVKAVKVVFENGRVDYIIYSLKNTEQYTIIDGDHTIKFKGFLGVQTLNRDGEIIYSYLNDGTRIGDLEGIAAYNGIVTDFTKTLGFDNYINVKFDTEINPDELVGRFAYINNQAFEIMDVDTDDNRNVILDVGDGTLIKSITDSGNYTHLIGENMAVRIPLSQKEDMSPAFSEIKDARVATGARYTTIVGATSPIGKSVEFEAIRLPRGANFDEKTGIITWTPDKKQIGKYDFAVTAKAGGLESTQHFTVTVHKSIGSSEASTENGNLPAGPGSGGGGGAAAGGGGGTQPDDTQPEGTTPENTKPNVNEEDKFIDLGNYAWAEDSIYALVEKGVVNGTSAKTYSPAANIKRADFAIMLTRAFEITSGDAEQFADVDSGKYYAEELRLAKSAGIVAGIGNDKFNPEGEITRQDMMVMLYRALKAQGYELSEPDHSVLADFTDSALIADYAKDAVSVLIKDGVITGSNGRINPKAQATRAEIAVMLSRALVK